MAKVEITESLLAQINKKFKQESVEAQRNSRQEFLACKNVKSILCMLQHLKSLESSPHKGKFLGTVGAIVIKELKYSGFRFYFITDGFKIKCLEEEKLVDLLLRFVRMSDKNHQQETINEIKRTLNNVGILVSCVGV